MDTLAEIVAAARRLDPAQLGDLQREIERLDKESRAIRFEAGEAGGVACHLIRLADGELWELLRRSLATKDDSLAVYWMLYGPSASLRLSQPAAYLALKHLSGESGRWFDNYKCSFSFPFALDVAREGRTFPYLLEVRNYGGGLRVPHPPGGGPPRRASGGAVLSRAVRGGVRGGGDRALPVALCAPPSGRLGGHPQAAPRAVPPDRPKEPNGVRLLRGQGFREVV
jgi:hypothetical protein